MSDRPTTGSTQARRTAESALRCPECDYDLTGAPGDRCPWCGWTIDVDVLIAETEHKPAGPRVASVAGALAVGVGSLLGVTALLSRGMALDLYDGITVLSVVLAAGGHLFLAALCLRDRSHWPLRRGEAANILLFLGWLSIVTAMVGASHVLGAQGGARGVEGVVVSGALEFFVRGLLFTLPGWTLLVLRFASFRGPHDPPASSTATRRTNATTATPDGATFRVDVFGRFEHRQLTQNWTAVTRPTTPAIEALIAATWETERALAASGDRMLYDGTLARLVDLTVTPEALHLELGATCYRDFLGTNLHNAERVLRESSAEPADPLGVSATVITRDGYLALGRRGRRVAYHSGCLHPFGGMVELDSPHGPAADAFGSAIRELREELNVEESEVNEIVIVGLVRDRSLDQPELLFDAEIALDRATLLERFDAKARDAEHTDIVFIFDEPIAIASFLTKTADITPIAQSALLLHGRGAFGETWYEQTCYVLYGELPTDAVPSR